MTEEKEVESSSKKENDFLNFTEQTEQESAWEASTLDKPYNSDDLYQKTGDYSTYEEMGKDDQVSICNNIVKDLVLGSGYTFIQDDTQEGAQDDVIADLDNTFGDEMETPFEEKLEEILSGYKYGFSVSEKLFKKRLDGSVGIKDIKTRHPNTWLIHSDKQGNVTKYEQQGIKGKPEIDPRSLIHFINKPLFQNPYGLSDFRAAYNAYFVKKNVVRFYAIFLESCAKPIPVGRYESGIKEKSRTALLNVLKKFQAKTAIVIPKELEVQFLETKSKGEAFKMALELFNMYIGRSMFCPDLLGFQGASSASGGSQALGKEQVSIFFRHIARKRLTLEKLVNFHLVRPICAWNHGITENCPKFKLNPITEDDALAFATKFLEAVKARAYKPTEDEINHFRKIINFPKGEVEFYGERTEEPTDGEESPFDNDEDNDEKKPEDDKEPGEENVEDLDNEAQDDIDKMQGKYAKDIEVPKDERVDYKAIESLLDSNIDKINRDARGPLHDVFVDLIAQVERKKILQGHPERLDSLKIKPLKKVNSILKKVLKDNFVENKRIARKELFKREYAEPLASEEFLTFLDSETFDAVGKWDYTVNEQAKVGLREAIKDGKNLDYFVKFTTKTEEDIAVRMERYSRTKLTETMNKGRLEFFNDSGVVDGYEFSAIDDGRTSDICASLNGKKFTKGTEPIPPLHFNCRSVLLPITIFEDFKPDKKVGSKDIDVFIEQNKGEGFSRR